MVTIPQKGSNGFITLACFPARRFICAHPADNPGWSMIRLAGMEGSLLVDYTVDEIIAFLKQDEDKENVDH